jgi:hypothetical protein
MYVEWGIQAPLTDYWTDFESENGFEKVSSLTTILVQVFIDQRYSLTPQGPISTKSPSPDNRAYCWADFESENGLEKVLPLATIVVQGFIDQSFSLTLQGPICTNFPSQIIGPRPPDRLLVLFLI